jgi:hypothetical protein
MVASPLPAQAARGCLGCSQFWWLLPDRVIHPVQIQLADADSLFHAELHADHHSELRAEQQGGVIEIRIGMFVCPCCRRSVSLVRCSRSSSTWAHSGRLWCTEVSSLLLIITAGLQLQLDWFANAVAGVGSSCRKRCCHLSALSLSPASMSELALSHTVGHTAMLLQTSSLRTS